MSESRYFSDLDYLTPDVYDPSMSVKGWIDCDEGENLAEGSIMPFLADATFEKRLNLTRLG